jgi:hypothetical protein
MIMAIYLRSIYGDAEGHVDCVIYLRNISPQYISTIYHRNISPQYISTIYLRNISQQISLRHIPHHISPPNHYAYQKSRKIPEL